MRSCVCGVVTANSGCAVLCSGQIIQCVCSKDYTVKNSAEIVLKSVVSQSFKIS